MNLHFQHMMREATRLTRAGDLNGATEAIQIALRAGRDAPTSDVMDVESRFVPEQEGPLAPLILLEPGEPLVRDTQDTYDTPESFIAGSFGTGPSARDYKLYTPPRAGTRPLPLLVMLHGCTQNPDDFAAGTGMNAEARAQGMYVLYPAQSAKANPQRCWNWFKRHHQKRGGGEAGIVAQLTQHIAGSHLVDQDRIYVAGLSAGGAMAAVLARAYPDVFAAAGVHSGLPPGCAQDLQGALQAMKGMGAAPSEPFTTPTIVFHGDADATVHPVNAERMFDTALGADGFEEVEQGRSPGGRAWTRRIRRDADGKPRGELWQVQGGPHAWSGGRAAGSYTDPQGPNATEAMVRFFAQHRLGPA